MINKSFKNSSQTCLSSKETAADAIDNEMFERARVAEKIKMLEGYLPDIPVKNATIYGILSKGIRELSEEECQKYFPVVKECIYQILGMWESEREEKGLMKMLKQSTEPNFFY